jgi:hypothetical protein
MSWRSSPRPPDPAMPDIPFVQIRYEIAERWFAIARKNADDIQKGIDQDLQPRSFFFPDSPSRWTPTWT